MSDPDGDILFCIECGYDLHGLDPECGAKLDLEQLRVSQIPWTYRKQMGRFSAYWRTVWLIVFQNTRFCREAFRPVSNGDAQRFRWMTVSHVFAAAIVLTVMLISFVGVKPPFVTGSEWGWALVVEHLFLLLFLVAVTGVQSYWFGPRSLPVRRQNRAIALSYYASAPLAFAPMSVSIFVLGFVRFASS